MFDASNRVGFEVSLPDNVWGSAQSRSGLNVQSAPLCGRTLKVLVDPVLTTLSAEPTGEEPAGGVFQGNVFPSASFTASYPNPYEGEYCPSGGQLQLTPISPSTLGGVKQLFRME